MNVLLYEKTDASCEAALVEDGSLVEFFPFPDSALPAVGQVYLGQCARVMKSLQAVFVRLDGKNEYITFRPSQVLDGSWDMELGARDLVRLHKVAYAPAKPDFDRFTDAVLIRGPAQFPGLYAWEKGMKLSSLQKLASIVLDTNQVYADIHRPLPGGKSQLITFAPREVAEGLFDLELMPKDTLSFYSMATMEEAKAEARETPIVQAPVGESGFVGGGLVSGAAPGAMPSAGGAQALGATTGPAASGSSALAALVPGAAGAVVGEGLPGDGQSIHQWPACPGRWAVAGPRLTQASPRVKRRRKTPGPPGSSMTGLQGSPRSGMSIQGMAS